MSVSPADALVRVLAAPLEPALAAATAACLAQVAPLRPEEWRLPAGSHTVGAGVLTVQAPGRHVRLVAPERCTIAVGGGALFEAAGLSLDGIDFTFSGGGGAALTVRAEALAALSAVTVAGGAVAVTAEEVAVSRLEVKATDAATGIDLHGDTVNATGLTARLLAPPAGPQIGVLATATAVLALADVTVAGVHGDSATGIEASAPRINLSALTISDIGQIGGAPGTGRATGIAALAAESAVVTGVRVRGVTGERAVGASLAVAGAPAGAGPELGQALGLGLGLRVLDLTVQEIQGVAFGAGLLLGSGAPADLRGFTVRLVRADAAMAALAFVGRGLSTTVGEVSEIYGRLGRSAGVRILAAPSVEPVRVGDLAVQSVGRRPAVEPDDGVVLPAPPAVAPVDEWDPWPELALDGLRLLGSDLAATAATARTPSWRSTPRVRAGLVELPPLPLPVTTAPEIAGVHVGAWVDESRAAGGNQLWGEIEVQDCLVTRIAGTALQIAGGLRPLLCARTELSLANAAGWVQGDESLLAQLTVHRHGTGLVLGPGSFRLVDDIISGIGAGPSCPLEPDAERMTVAAVFTTSVDPGEDHRFESLGPLPFVDPGPEALPPTLAVGLVPPAAPLDLRLLPAAAVAARAVPVPGPRGAAGLAAGGGKPFLGAHEPEAAARCAARDPEPHLWAAPGAPTAPDPVVDYRGRDNAALLALMRDRARVTMPSWTERGPADFVTVLLEMLSHRLDVESYAQERAVAEGFLETAQLRRSVEDHARALDYAPDRGLSATTMLSFRLETPLATVPGLPEDKTALIPALTMVGTVDVQEASMIFATEEPLRLVPGLNRVRLAASCPAGATFASLQNLPGTEHLQVGRWLVFHRGAHDPGHVIRITSLDRQPTTTTIGWDPRRPLPRAIDAEAAGDLEAGPGSLLGNVVPAHHGVPLAAMKPGEKVADDPLLGRWRHLLDFDADGTAGREVELPFGPVAVQAPGYPLPGDEGRLGTPALRLSVDGDEWRLVEDLATADGADEVFALRAGEDGAATALFGDGTSGASLPRRSVRIRIDVRVGLGRAANVGAGRLSRLVQLGGAATGETELERRLGLPPGADGEDRLRQVLLVENPMAAIGGRDPEALPRIRYRAPFNVMDARSAITPRDYERLLGALPEVAAARARVNDEGVRPLVRVTVLLRDQDTLDDDERLRRWAGVRRQLERMRLLGCDVEAAPPQWVPLDLDLVVDAAPHARVTAVESALREALAGNGGLLDPDRVLLGGDVHLSRLYEVALAVPGVRDVRVKRFRRLAPDAPDQLAAGVIPIGPEEVPIVRVPYRARFAEQQDGLLTVTVCGGLR